MTTNEITFEICTNTEALRDYCGLDLIRIEDGLENEAADEFCECLFQRLEDAGFNCERAKGERMLCHGWNGANTFAHKIGPVGTFDELTPEQIETVSERIDNAMNEVYEQFAPSPFDGVEAVYPHGRHSMCPILRAARSELREALAADAPIAEKFTCRRVTLDLQPLPYPPQAVIATRRLLRVSQPVFAQFLGVKPATVKSWEQGRQHAPDIACRFMDEIQRNPEYWRDRLRESIRVKSM